MQRMWRRIDKEGPDKKERLAVKDAVMESIFYVIKA